MLNLPNVDALRHILYIIVYFDIVPSIFHLEMDVVSIDIAWVDIAGIDIALRSFSCAAKDGTISRQKCYKALSSNL